MQRCILKYSLISGILLLILFSILTVSWKQPVDNDFYTAISLLESAKTDAGIDMLQKITQAKALNSTTKETAHQAGYWLMMFYTFGINEMLPDLKKAEYFASKTLFYPLTLGYLVLDFYHQGPLSKFMHESGVVEANIEMECMFIEMLSTLEPSLYHDMLTHYQANELKTLISFEYDTQHVFRKTCN